MGSKIAPRGEHGAAQDSVCLKLDGTSYLIISSEVLWIAQPGGDVVMVIACSACMCMRVWEGGGGGGALHLLMSRGGMSGVVITPCSRSRSGLSLSAEQGRAEFMCRYAGSFGPKRFHRGHSAGAEAGITARFDYAKTAIINLIGESLFFRPSVGPVCAPGCLIISGCLVIRTTYSRLLITWIQLSGTPLSEA